MPACSHFPCRRLLLIFNTVATDPLILTVVESCHAANDGQRLQCWSSTSDPQTCTRAPLKRSHLRSDLRSDLRSSDRIPCDTVSNTSCTHIVTKLHLCDTQISTTALQNHEGNDKERASCVSSPAVCSRQQGKLCATSLPLENSHRQEGQLKSCSCTGSSRQVYLQSIAPIKIACRHIVAAVVATLSCWLSLVKAVLLVLETIVYA